VYHSSLPLFGCPLSEVNVRGVDVISRKQNGWYCVEIDKAMVDTRCCYLQLYIKILSAKLDEAVIAIRGTHNIDNVKQDVATWFTEAVGGSEAGQYPAVYLHDVQMFFRQVRLYLHRVAPSFLNRVVFCGHSLGGALAKIMVAQFDGYQAVVFNAPGVSKLVLCPHRTASIYAVNAKYGILNKVGQRLPGVQLSCVDVMEGELEAKKLFQYFNRYGAAEYERGKKVYAGSGLLSKVTGVVMDLDALMESSRAFETQPDFVRGERECEAVSVYAPMSYSPCLNGLYLTEYRQVIKEQHSMNNMLKTLRMSRYMPLAYRVIL